MLARPLARSIAQGRVDDWGWREGLAAWRTEGAFAVWSIHAVDLDRDTARVGELFWEYLQWADARLREEYGIDLDIESLQEQSMRELAKFAPPHGSLLLATDDTQVAGVACMRRLDEQTVEIKRMYVRERYRGMGIGRALLRQLLEQAREVGYSMVKLDSTRFMTEAHALYRSEGFREIGPYPGSEIPKEFQKHWVFMERDL
jgi:GNAT superfamily N-acetyltransferase